MKRFVNYRKFVAVMAIMAFCLVLAMPQAFAGEVWQQKFSRFSATAGETLAIGDVVCIANADGYAYLADANDSSLRPAVGVIGKGGASGAVVEIIDDGILAGQTAVSTGYRLFLSETAGAMTTTSPTNAQIVGWVMPTSGSTTTSSTYRIKVIPETSGGAGF